MKSLSLMCQVELILMVDRLVVTPHFENHQQLQFGNLQLHHEILWIQFKGFSETT